MKKVFLCITKSSWGGAQKYIFDLALSLSKYGLDVTVLAGGNGELFDILRTKNIKTIPLRHSFRNTNIFSDIALLFELYSIFRTNRPDIVHLNSSKIGFVGSLSARFSGIKKIIFTAHGWAFNENRNILSKIFFWIIQMKTILLSHKTICVSKAVFNQIPKLLRKRAVLIYNGIIPTEMLKKDDSRDLLIERMHSGNILGENIKKRKWIGTIAELHKNKGLKYAIEAMSKVKENIVYIIIGEGEKRKELERQIKTLGLEGIVILTGKIENAQQLLKAFDIFLLPSITEALPYSLLEAGVAGLDTVASNVGGVGEIIDDKETGILIKPRSAESIKRALEYISKVEHCDFGTKLKDRVETRFNHDKMFEDTINIYLNN